MILTLVKYLKRTFGRIASSMDKKKDNFEVLEELTEKFESDPANMTQDELRNLFEKAHDFLQSEKDEIHRQPDWVESVNEFKRNLNPIVIEAWQNADPKESEGDSSIRIVQKVSEWNNDPNSVWPPGIYQVHCARLEFARESKSAENLDFLPFEHQIEDTFRFDCPRCECFAEEQMRLYPDTQTGRVVLAMTCPVCGLIGTIGTVIDGPIWSEIPVDLNEQSRQLQKQIQPQDERL